MPSIEIPVMLGGSRAATGRGEELVSAVEGAVALSSRSGWTLHGCPPWRTRVTTMSAGRLQRARFSRRHGMGSILLRKEVGNLLLSNMLLYRQASVHTSQITVIGVAICLLNIDEQTSTI
jgi:hypothetical protein